jgi:hypothetical protein
MILSSANAALIGVAHETATGMPKPHAPAKMACAPAMYEASRLIDRIVYGLAESTRTMQVRQLLIKAR